MGRIMVKLMDKLMGLLQTAAAAPVEEALETATLCSIAYALVARREIREDRTKPKSESEQWKVLRRRLQLAEADKWHQLVDELIFSIKESGNREENAKLFSAEEENPARCEEHRRMLALRKVKLDCARTAAQLLRGQSMLPPSETTAEAQCCQLVCDRLPAEQQDFEAAMEEAKAAASETKLQVSERTVRKRLALLRLGAQPGGSGCRNDVVIAIGEVKSGVKCLREWCQCWADGHVPLSVVAILAGQVLRPIRKENGKPRNISLMECLVKFASGIVQDAIRSGKVHDTNSTQEGLHWSQYGGQPAGPELMLMVHQGLMNLRPQLTYVSLDGENAFGCIKRAAMLRGTAKWCPAHAPFLVSQWNADNKAWVQVSEKSWKEVSLKEGTAQGDTA